MKLLILFLTIALAMAYPGGAPSEACGSMVPFHGRNDVKEGEAAPFEILAMPQENGQVEGKTDR